MNFIVASVRNTMKSIVARIKSVYSNLKSKVDLQKYVLIAIVSAVIYLLMFAPVQTKDTKLFKNVRFARNPVSNIID